MCCNNVLKGMCFLLLYCTILLCYINSIYYIVPTAQICFNECFVFGELLFFMTNKLFILIRIVDVNGKSYIFTG